MASSSSGPRWGSLPIDVGQAGPVAVTFVGTNVPEAPYLWQVRSWYQSCGLHGQRRVLHKL
eukprot:8893584-Alexandrium_andersonii.AAC.1